ncbi:MAG: InlB B-repeat-containing protein [Firmicutes bacterium]|nr:InlB B-repeat-containing protein [Bacillota bacterium]
MKKIKLIVPMLLIIAICTAILTACPQNYTVTFNTHGGTPVPSIQTVAYGQKATKPNTEPAKTGYDFVRWADSHNGEKAFDFAATPIRKNTTIHAVWKQHEQTENTYKFEFTAIEGATVEFNPSEAVEAGKEVEITITILNTHKKGDNFSVSIADEKIDNLTWENNKTTITKKMIKGGGAVVIAGLEKIDNTPPRTPVSQEDIDAAFYGLNFSAYEGAYLYQVTPSLPNGWAWRNENDLVGEVGKQEHEAFLAQTSTNYEATHKVTVDVKEEYIPAPPYSYAKISIPNNLPNNTFTLSYIQREGKEFSVDQWLTARPNIPYGTQFSITTTNDSFNFSGIGYKNVDRYEDGNHIDYIEFNSKLKQVLAHEDYEIEAAAARFDVMSGNLYIDITINGIKHTNVFKPNPIKIDVPDELTGKAFMLDRREGYGVSQHPILGKFTIEILPNQVVFGAIIDQDVNHMIVPREGGIEINDALKQILAHQDYVITAARINIAGEELHIYVTIHGIENRNVFVPIGDVGIKVPNNMPSGVFLLEHRYIGQVGQNIIDNMGGAFSVEVIRREDGIEGRNYSYLYFTVSNELGADLTNRKQIRIEDDTVYFDADLRNVLAHGAYNITHAYAQMADGDLHIVVYNMGIKNINVFKLMADPIIDIDGMLPIDGKFTLSSIRSYMGWKYWGTDRVENIPAGLITIEFDGDKAIISNNHPDFAPDGELTYTLDLNGTLEWNEDLRRVFGGGHYEHAEYGLQRYFPTAVRVAMDETDLVITMVIRGTVHNHVFVEVGMID